MIFFQFGHIVNTKKIKPYPAKAKHIGACGNEIIETSTILDEQILVATSYMSIGYYITVKYGKQKYKGKLVRMYYPSEYSPNAYMEVLMDRGEIKTFNMDAVKILSVEEND